MWVSKGRPVKKDIYLIDLSHEGKLGVGSDTMPLQLGLIGAYCLKEHGDRVNIQIFKKVKEFEEAVLNKPPFLVASSNYLWNIDLGYKFIQAVKRLHPGVITVFGGPNYPNEFDEQVTWLRRYPEVDFYIFKDGEVPFASLVGFLLDTPDVAAAKRAKLESCHALHEDTPYFGEVSPRLRDLTSIPSPYTTGLMDKFFSQSLIPTIQTNRGCPFTCTFCTEGGGYYTKVYRSSTERAITEVGYIVERLVGSRTLRITDSNFGMYKEDLEFCKYLHGLQQKTGYPEFVMCSAGKNKKERILECNDLLGGAMRLTASVQSLNPGVLENIKRTNISMDAIMALSDRVSDTDTHSYSELILALPGDSMEATAESIDGLMQAGISNITQHQLALIHGTDLNSSGTRKKFGLKSMFRPIQRCVGQYSFDGKTFPAIEIEEICVANQGLTFENYLEARLLYLSVGLFYNDRVFGEIHALLRLLQLPTFGWIKKIHDNRQDLAQEIKKLYEDFLAETEGELWPSEKELIEDVAGRIEHYLSGEAGGNIIYKYRAKSILEHFQALHETAFSHLRDYLDENDVRVEEIVGEIEAYSRHRKTALFNLDYLAEEDFSFDIPRLVSDPSLARGERGVDDLSRAVHVSFRHSPKQRELISRQLKFYGDDIAGITLLISRFPLKRFYRQASSTT